MRIFTVRSLLFRRVNVLVLVFLRPFDRLFRPVCSNKNSRVSKNVYKKPTNAQ